MAKFSNCYFCKYFENLYMTSAKNISYISESSLFLYVSGWYTRFIIHYSVNDFSCYWLYHIFQTPVRAMKSDQKIKCKSFFTTHTSRSRRKRRRILGSIERCTTMLSNDESKRRWRLIMIDVLTTRD